MSSVQQQPKNRPIALIVAVIVLVLAVILAGYLVIFDPGRPGSGAEPESQPAASEQQPLPPLPARSAPAPVLAEPLPAPSHSPAQTTNTTAAAPTAPAEEDYSSSVGDTRRADNGVGGADTASGNQTH